MKPVFTSIRIGKYATTITLPHSENPFNMSNILVIISVHEQPILLKYNKSQP